ncbi:hypothetical protein Tco_0449454 [Tanacetum coccineum]
MIISRIYMLYMNCIGCFLSRIINPQETEQVIAHDELWVPTAERVNISTTNVRLETTVKAKEEPSIGIDRTRILTSSRHSPFMWMSLKFSCNSFGPLQKYTNMFVDHMHQPWRTLAACINKCLSGKTASNDKLRKTRIDILWGMFYRENVIIDYFLSKHKSLKKLKFQHFHTIKDDGVVSRLKFVRMGEDVQQYGLVILATMLNNEIIQLESYKMFILHSTGQIPPKKSRGKGSQWKKTADLTEESVDVSDNLTKAEEEAAARQVHATHARIVSESVPEPARRRRSDIAISETTQKLKGIQTLTPAEQEAADIIIAPQDNKECLGMTSWINVRKNADTEMKDAEKTTDITKETTEQPLTSSSFSVPSDYGNQFLNLSHNEEIFEQPPVLQQTTPIPTTITTPPINTEALAITTTIPEITPFIALQLRVAKLEQDMSEVKKIDHSAAILASIQSHVPPVVDKYVGTKLDDALLKALERHTADLVEKYFVLPTLESSKKQESEKSLEEIIKIKREQEEKKQEPTYTIKLTDKAALEEFNLKSALFKSMHKNKSANRNPANYRLYHALMEALIEDENAMDKEVADTVKDHKRKHDGDDDDDDDDEGPPARSNQGSKTGKSAPAKDPVEEPTDKVIMDEQPTKDIPISDEGHVSDLEDIDNAHMPKVPDTTTWFRPIPKEERHASPEPEWVIPPIDLPEADNNWANAFAKAHQDPDENKLHNKIDDIGSFIRWYCRRIGKEELSKADLEGPAFMMVKGFHENNISLQFQMEECHKLLTNQIDLVNPEGHRIVLDISNPLPLGGPPGQVTIQPQFFFNKDLEYLLTGDKERNRALSISKLKAALYQDFGLEELVPSLWIESEQVYDISAAYGITHWWFSRKQFYINKHSEPSDRDAVRSHMRIFSVISIRTYERYGYNYLREIVLRRADYNEYKISENDFKSLHPNDFEDLNILYIQGKLDHLPKKDKLGIESYQTKLNLEQPNWDAPDFPFKEDYTIVFKPRAVIYRDRDDNRKMMRINEVHKFSDGTLTRIKEKLDFMVKDFKLFKFNKGMENRKWTEDDKRRSEDFIEVIERRLKIRRIFRSLESFVGGRLRDIDYRLISRTEKSENKGIVPTEMELVLEYTQQGSSHEVSDTLPILLSSTHYGNKTILRVLRIILVILPEHPSETKVFHNEDGNPARVNIKQALGSFKDGDGDGDTHYERSHKGVKASANSDIMYFFTSAQDGDPLQDDVRLCLGDDLKKAQDHNQRQVKDESKDHYPKYSRYQMKN